MVKIEENFAEIDVVRCRGHEYFVSTFFVLVSEKIGGNFWKILIFCSVRTKMCIFSGKNQRRSAQLVAAVTNVAAAPLKWFVFERCE